MNVIRMIWQPKHCTAGSSGANTTVSASNGPAKCRANHVIHRLGCVSGHMLAYACALAINDG